MEQRNNNLQVEHIQSELNKLEKLAKKKLEAMKLDRDVSALSRKLDQEPRRSKNSLFEAKRLEEIRDEIIYYKQVLKELKSKESANKRGAQIEYR